MTKRIVRLPERGETGFVMIWLAICTPVLLGMLAFAIDIGSWYLRAQQIQRASDAAALAGAGQMPNVSLATTAATEILKKNGFVDGDKLGTIVATVTPQGDARVEIIVEDTDVPTIFGQLLDQANISIKRRALGEYTRPLEMGSPKNKLGTGDLTCGSSAPPTCDRGGEAADIDNFWLAVNGFCTAKEDGDYVLSRYKANKKTNGQKKTGCGPGSLGSPGAPNGDLNNDIGTAYDENGYDYVVRLPADVSLGGPTLRVWDPAFAPSVNYGADGKIDRSTGFPGAGGDDPARITTIFTVYDTNNSFNTADDTLVSAPSNPKTFDTDDADGVKKWFNLATLPPVAGREYRLNVRTQKNQAASWGINAFGLQAKLPWSGSSYLPTDRYFTEVCNVEFINQCPNIYGMGRISTYVSLNNPYPRVPLARIDPAYVGKPVEISLFDPGEKTNAVSIEAPSGRNVTLGWKAAPGSPITKDADGTTDPSDPWVYTDTQKPPALCDPNPPGCIPIGPNRSGTSKFNERMLAMSFLVPSDYSVGGAGWSFPITKPPGFSTWWNLKYAVEPGFTPTDRTTWTARVTGTDPIHLVTDE